MGTGGHAPALEVAEQAVRHGVRRLVFAHIGRPTIAALDGGHVPPFAEIGLEGGLHTVSSGASGAGIAFTTGLGTPVHIRG